MQQPDDQIDPSALIRKAKQGDMQALSQLVAHYRPYLAMLARLDFARHLQAKYDDSDLVQETLVVVQRDLAAFEGTTEPELAAWLRRIMASVSGKHLRHFSRQRRDAFLEQQIEDDLGRSSQMVGAVLTAPDASPSEHVAQRERAVLLARALDQLPPDYRDALIINRLQGQTLAETATRMGRSVESVRKLLARGLLELRRRLEGRL